MNQVLLVCRSLHHCHWHEFFEESILENEMKQRWTNDEIGSENFVQFKNATEQQLQFQKEIEKHFSMKQILKANK